MSRPGFDLESLDRNNISTEIRVKKRLQPSDCQSENLHIRPRQL